MKITYLRSTIASLLLGTSLNLAFTGFANAQAISFEELIANPGNVSMELQFARQQERTQNYLSALSAYERVLLNYAENDEARLRYAELLTRLDDPQAARREIEILEKRELTADQSRRFIAIGGTPVSSDGGGGFFGEVSAGVRYDNNIGAALIEFPFEVDEDDFAGTLSATAGYATPVSDSLSVHLGVHGNTVRHEEISVLDYGTWGGFAGFGLQTGDTGKLSFDLVYNNTNINNNRYQRQIGGRIKGIADVSDTVQWVVNAAYFDQDFEDIAFQLPFFGTVTVAGDEGLRSGGYLNLATGPRIKLGESAELGILVGFDDKSADATRPDFAYDGWYIGADFNSMVGEKSYIKAEALYRDLSYDDGIREDQRLYGRAALGVSLDSVISLEGIDLFLETGVAYLQRKSDPSPPPISTGFPDYENLSLDSRIVAKF